MKKYFYNFIEDPFIHTNCQNTKKNRHIKFVHVLRKHFCQSTLSDNILFLFSNKMLQYKRNNFHRLEKIPKQMSYILFYII